MKPVVGIAVTPPQNDISARYGLHAARNYAAAFARIGFEPVIAQLGDGDPATIERLLQPQVTLLFSHGGWLMAPDGPFGSGIREALRTADKPTIVIIGDPPFSPWLPSIFANLPPRAVPFFIDPSFADGIAHWIPSRRSAAYLPVAHMLDGNGPMPTKDKTIPLLFVGKTFDAARLHDRVRTKYPGQARIFEALVETNLADLEKPLTHVAAEVLPALGEAFDMDNAGIRDLLHLADQYIRQKRRNLVLDRLVKYRGVIVSSPGLARLPPGSTATLLSGQPFPKSLELLRSAHATMVCQPHYPGALNERIVHAMHARCAVIATPNVRTTQLFSGRQHLLTTAPDLSDLDALVDAVGRRETAEPMRDRALPCIAERHLPENAIRYMLAFMAESGLLDDAIEVPPGPRMVVPPLPPRAPLARPS